MMITKCIFKCEHKYICISPSDVFRGREPWDPRKLKGPAPAAGKSVLEALLEEREEGW